MLILLLTFLLLIEIFTVVGLAVLRAVPDLSLRPGDTLVLSLWLGFFACANLLLLIALLVPLSGPLSVILVSIIILVALTQRKIRAQFVALHRYNNVGPFWPIIALFAAVASLVASGGSSCGDTGNYHFQAVKWLSEYGIVPGLANFQHRFGFATSWYSIPAILNHGLLADRIQGIAGGLCYLLFWAQVVTSARHFLLGIAKRSDHVVAGALLIIWPLRIFEIVSLSPNLGLILGLPFCLWVAALNKNSDEQVMPTDSSIVFLFLLSTAGIASTKITGVILFVAGIVFYCMRAPLRYIFSSVSRSMLLVLLAAPTIVSSIMLSGYPFYPSTLFGISFDWKVSSETIAMAKDGVWLYWSCAQFDTCSNSKSNQLLSWIAGNKNIIWLLVLSALTIVLHLKREQSNLFFRILLLTQVVSATLILLNGPGETFLIGWLGLVPILLFKIQNVGIYLTSFGVIFFLLQLLPTRFNVAAFCAYAALILINYLSFSATVFRVEKVNRAKRVFLATAGIVLIILSLNIDIRLKQEESYENFLYQPSMPYNLTACPFVEKLIAGFQFTLAERTQGTKCQCWHHALPCTLEKPPETLRLRDPECGLGCGVVVASTLN